MSQHVCCDLGEDDWSLLRGGLEERQRFYERATNILVTKGGSHWCCRYPELVRELIWLWQFDSQPTVCWLQSKLEEQLGQGCFPCVLEMNSSREEAVQGLDSEKIRHHLELWEAARLKRKLEQLSPSVQASSLTSSPDWHESITVQQLICSLLEILMRPRLLAIDGLNGPFTACLLRLLDLDDKTGTGPGLTISAGRWLAGVYYLCGHAHERIRNWARGQGVLEDLVGVVEALVMDEENGDSARPITCSSPFTSNPREAWMGILAVVNVLHRRILDECLLPRFPTLLPLAALAVLAGGAALFPATRLLGHLFRTLGQSIWPHFPPAYQPPGLLWDAFVGHVVRGGCGPTSSSVPVRKAAMEVLPTLLDALEGRETASERMVRSRDLMDLLCGGPRLHAAPAVIRDIATLVAVRAMQDILSSHGPSRLPFACATLWVPHLVGTACSPGAAAVDAVRAQVTTLLCVILDAQAAGLVEALLGWFQADADLGKEMPDEERSHVLESAATNRSDSKDVILISEDLPHPKSNITLSPTLEGLEEAGRVPSADDDSMLCETLWSWLTLRAGANTVPLDLHAKLMSAVAGVLFWHATWSTIRLHLVSPSSDGVDAGEVPGSLCPSRPTPRQVLEIKSKACESFENEVGRLRHCHSVPDMGKAAKSYARMSWLGLKAVGDIAADTLLAASVLKHSEVAVEAAVTMLLSPHQKARKAAVTILLGGLRGYSTGNSAQALDVARSENHKCVIRSLTAACSQILDHGGGIDGPGFACLQHLFFVIGENAAGLFGHMDNSCREENENRDDGAGLIRSLWSLSKEFIRSRARMRSSEFESIHGSTAVEDTAAQFFPFFTKTWQWIQHLPFSSESDDSLSEEDDKSIKTTLVAHHSEWLPALSKWGGVASSVVRSSWSESIVAVLGSIQRSEIEYGSLTSRERKIFESLLARRDFWTDEQLLALGRALGPLGLASSTATFSECARGVGGYGNLGAPSLAALPSAVLPSVAPPVKSGKTSEIPAVRSSTPDQVMTDGMVPKSRRKRNRQIEENSKKSEAKASAEMSSAPGKEERMHRKASAQDKRPTVLAKPKHRKKDKLVSESQISDLSAKCLVEESGRCDVEKRNKRGISRPESLASLAASAAAVAAVGAGAATDQLRCVTIRIGGVEVQVPMLARGAKSQSFRPIKSAAELEADMHKSVLALDIAEVLKCDENGKSIGGGARKLKRLPLRFGSADEYEDFVAPLLMNECIEQLAASFRENVQDRPKSGAICRVTDVTECGAFHFVRLSPDHDAEDRWSWDGENYDETSGLNERDIVLLLWNENGNFERSRKSAGNRASKEQALPSMKDTGSFRTEILDVGCGVKNLSEHLYALCLVDRQRERGRHNVQLKLYLGGKGHRMDGLRHRLTIAANRAQELAASKGKHSNPSSGYWKLFRLQASLSTSEREYIAVHSIRALPQYVQTAILDPVPLQPRKKLEKSEMRQMEPTAGMSSLNYAQQLAVAAGLDRTSPFTLIQGPPGTGKTRTIVSLVSALVGAHGAGGKWVGARVLVCAPSNAAVDEIAMRLYEGLENARCGTAIRVVRVGNRGQMRPDVWEAMSIDRIAERGQSGSLPGEEGADRSNPGNLIGAATRGVGDEQSAAVRALGRAVRDAAAADSQRRQNGQLARARILAAARVVCSTLSGAGSAAVRAADRSSVFDVVVVDEAAQAVEASALIPLPLVCGGGGGGVFKCVLVGDPQQLPATVLSRAAEEHLYGRSLFERLQGAGHEPLLLSVQYRMHPIIREFPSAYFYGGRLEDGCSGVSKSAEWHKDLRFGPLVIYDVHSEEQRSAGGSLCNLAEAQVCAEALRALADDHLGGGAIGATSVRSRVVVLTPYRRQAHSTGIGFVADVRRMNVALTRARSSLLVLCNTAVLSQNQHWKAFVMQAQGARRCVRAEKVFNVVNDLDHVSSYGAWMLDEWPVEYLSRPCQMSRIVDSISSDTSLPKPDSAVKRHCRDRHDKGSEKKGDSNSRISTAQTTTVGDKCDMNEKILNTMSATTQAKDNARKRDPNLAPTQSYFQPASAEKIDADVSRIEHSSKRCQSSGEGEHGLPRCPKKKNATAAEGHFTSKKFVACASGYVSCTPKSGTDEERTSEKTKYDSRETFIENQTSKKIRILSSESVNTTNSDETRAKGSEAVCSKLGPGISQLEHVSASLSGQVIAEPYRKQNEKQLCRGPLDKTSHEKISTSCLSPIQPGASHCTVHIIDAPGTTRKDCEPKKGAITKHVYASKPSSKLQQTCPHSSSEQGQARVQASSQSSDRGKNLERAIKTPESAPSQHRTATSKDNHSDKACGPASKFEQLHSKVNTEVCNVAEKGKDKQAGKNLQVARTDCRSPPELGNIKELPHSLVKQSGTEGYKGTQRGQQQPLQQKTKVPHTTNGSECCDIGPKDHHCQTLPTKLSEVGPNAEDSQRQRAQVPAPLPLATVEAGDVPAGWSRHWSKTWRAHYLFNARTGEQRWESGGPEKRSNGGNGGHRLGVGEIGCADSGRYGLHHGDSVESQEVHSRHSGGSCEVSAPVVPQTAGTE